MRWHLRSYESPRGFSLIKAAVCLHEAVQISADVQQSMIDDNIMLSFCWAEMVA
jgi:hypothetical protein